MPEGELTSLEKLNASLQAMAKGLSAESVKVVQKKLTFDVLAGVIKRTPVDEGRARGGWQVGINDPPASKSAKPEKGKLGDPAGSTLSEGSAKVADLPEYCVVWITNSVPYIIVLDQGGFVPKNPGPSKDKRDGRKGEVLVKDGYSIQAPNGMVDLTITELVDTEVKS